MLPFPAPMLMAGGGAAVVCPVQPTADTQDDYYDLVSVLLDATGQSNGTGYATGSSRYAQTITYAGGATISSGKFEFDGTDDYLTVPASSAHVPATAMTIRVYGVEFDNLSTDNKHLAGVWGTGTSRCWKIAYDITGHALVFGLSFDGTNSTNCSYSWVPGLGVSYDIEASWDGTTMRLYIDGLFVASQAASGTPFDGSAVPFSVGAFNSAGSWTNDFDGRIAAVQFTRDKARVTHTTGCYTRPKLPFATAQTAGIENFFSKVLFLMGADTALTDEGPGALTVSTFGNTVVDATQKKYGTKSAKFDGAGDYLTIPDSAALNLNGPFTLEAFVRWGASPVSTGIITKWRGSVGAPRSWTLEYNTSLGGLLFAYSLDGTNQTNLVGTWSPSASTWYHVAVCRDVFGKIRLFVDGTQIGSTATEASSFFDNSWPVYFGAQANAGTPNVFLNGWLDEVRITAADRYVQNFTAPAAAFPRS